MKKAVILLSGGLDSATCLAMAKAQGFTCYALSFTYGQRHDYEITAARQIAKNLGAADHRVVNLDIGQFGASALTDVNIDVPIQRESTEIPVTYVPARNTIFLSIALSFAESIAAKDIFIGANTVDYSGYPDCRPEFIEAFERVANLGTKQGIEGAGFNIQAPLLHLSKAQIIQAGHALGIDYGLTVSCYQLTNQGKACKQCDSCKLRQAGFKAAQMKDPTIYK